MNIAIFCDTGFIEGGSSAYAQLISETLSSLGHKIINITDKVEPNTFRLKTCKTPVVKMLLDAPLRKSLGDIKEKFELDAIHVNLHHPRLAYHFAKASQELHLPLVNTAHSYFWLCHTFYNVKLPQLTICDRSAQCFHCAICMVSKTKLLSKSKPPVVKDILLSSYYDYAKKFMLSLSYTISPSKLFAESLQKRTKAPVKFIPNPLPECIIHNCKPATAGDGSAVFLGRLIWEKGVGLLPSIAKRLDMKVLHVLGWGSLENWLKEHHSPNMVYHGFVTNAERLRILQQASVVIIPSIYMEMYPYVVLEAFAYGKPVVAFDLGGPKEQIEQSGAGLLAEPFNVNDFSDKVKWLLNNPYCAEEMGLRGKTWIKKILDPKMYAEYLTKIYTNISAQK